MIWHHECSIEWLRARQYYLTATDIYDLLPYTSSGRKRQITYENYLKIIARKEERISVEDTISTGAAARGHILEPYAIKMFNALDYSDKLYHWDDALVAGNNGLAYSPDALDIEQVNKSKVIYDELLEPEMIGPLKPKVIGEVKSYNTEKHLICGYKDKMELVERWQIAVAMNVSKSIKRAYLMFYNPRIGKQLFIKEYTRDDLFEEISIVNTICDEYKENVNKIIDELSLAKCAIGTKFSEELIYKEIEESKRLNP